MVGTLLTLEDLFREDGIKLHGSGDELDFLCPFHEDKTPSARVNFQKDVYFCHACGSKGNAVTYLKEARHMTGREAKDYLEGQPTAPVRRPRKEPSNSTVFPSLPKRNSAGAKTIAEHRYHDSDGKLVFVVCRYESFTEKQQKAATASKTPYRKCDMWTPEGKGWIAKGPPGNYKRPLWRLAKLMAAPKDQQVWLVEGEKCVQSAEKAFPQAIVTTWAGGTGAWDKTDFSPLYGRRILLLADADKTGRKAMTGISSLLWEKCPKIRIVLPRGESGQDIHDWIAKGGVDEVQTQIKKLVKDAPKPKQLKIQEQENEDLFENEYFRVMGNIGDRVAVLLSTFRLLTFPREGICRSPSLVAIADYQWWLSTLQQPGLSTAVCLHVGSQLIRRADSLGDINTRNMVGRGFFKSEDGRYIWHLGNRLHVDGKDIGLGELPGFLPVSGPPIRIKSEPATEAERKRLAKAILECRWETPYDGKRFMGWLVSSIVGGALSWRPHAWLNGLSGSGKSWLLDPVAKKICGDFYVPGGDTSVAGIARSVRSDSLAVFFDEAEPNRTKIEEILDILRLSSGPGGIRIRADRSTSGVDVFQPRFSALLSSINIASLNLANETRICQINLSRKKHGDWPKVEVEIHEALKDPGRFLSALIRDGRQIVERAETVTRKYVREGIVPRRAAIEAILTAAWEWWSGETVWLTSGAPLDSETMDDGEKMLVDLLGVRVRVPREPDMTLARVLLTGDKDDVALDHGLKISEGQLHIHPSHPSLIEYMSRSRSWSGVNVQKTLEKIPGATIRSQPLSFKGMRKRTVQIPRMTCEKLGLEIFGAVEDGNLYEDEVPF